MNAVRRAFEKWMELVGYRGSFTMSREGDGYLSPGIHQRWLGFQAGRAEGVGECAELCDTIKENLLLGPDHPERATGCGECAWAIRDKLLAPDPEPKRCGTCGSKRPEFVSGTAPYCPDPFHDHPEEE